MEKLSVIDISETALHNFDHEVMEKLLLDHSTSKGEIKKNIMWCTDDYAHLGDGYQATDQITIERITGNFDKLIRPRALKSLEEQHDRTKEKGEVFTPASGRRVSVKIGRFGPIVQIGDANDEEKPVFASLTEGQSLQTITLEEALKLFELPRKVGEHEGKEVTAAIGRFGPYIKYDGGFVSIPKDLAPQTITLEEALALIEAKKAEEANRLIKTFDDLPGVEVLRGRFGPYVAYKKEGARKAVNYKIPKGTDPEALTADEVHALMESQDSAPKKRAPKKK